MTTADFKPGDVAMVSAYNRKEPYRAYYDGKTWREYGLDAFCVDVPLTLRPLVVLVLEHPDLIVRALRDAASNDDHNAAPLRGIADQIADQAKPPKPVEPKGLGAVVEDSDHRKWVRRSNIPGDFPWDLATDRECCGVGWSQIDVVRVLSEGVAS